MGDYINRLNKITDKYIDAIKSASMTFMISDNGFVYDFNDSNAKDELLKHYSDIATYTEDNLESNTIYSISENGWGVEKDGEMLEEITSGNTYNQSYLGILDVNYRIYQDLDTNKWIGVVRPHLGGDIRGNYGQNFYIVGDNEEEVFLTIYYEFISGFATIQIEFDDGAIVVFDSQQDSDVWNFELVGESSDYEDSAIAKEYIDDFDESTDGDSFLEETVAMVGTPPKLSAYALGGTVDDNQPRAYVVSLSDYNDGKGVGKWIELSEFDDGDEVMTHINEFLDELNEKDGKNREEYEIHDYEGIGKEWYSESMGEEEFDHIIESYNDLKYADFPIEVFEQYKAETYSEPTLTFDVLNDMDNRYQGTYGDIEDYAISMVDDGVITDLSSYIEVSETDIRIIANEESDYAVESLDSDEDAIDQAQMTSDYEFERTPIEERIDELENEISTLEEQLEDVEGEDYDVISEQLSDAENSLVDEEGALQDLETEWGDKARESIREEVYDEVEDRLNNDLVGWLEERGYKTEDYKNINFVMVDYESLGDELSSDVTIIEDNSGEIHIFSNYYEGGGKIANEKPFTHFIIDKHNDSIVKGYYSLSDANADASKHKGKRIRVVGYKTAKNMALPVDNSSMFSEYVFQSDGQANLGRKARGGKIGTKLKSMASAVGRGASRLGRGVQHQWREADFGDGKGKAEFFEQGGNPMSRESIIEKYKAGELYDEDGKLVVSKDKMYQIVYLNDLRQNPNKYAMAKGGSAKYPRGYYPKIEFWGEKIVEGAEDEAIDNVNEAHEKVSHFIGQQEKLEHPERHQQYEPKKTNKPKKASSWQKLVKEHGVEKARELYKKKRKKKRKYEDGGVIPKDTYCRYCVNKAIDENKLNLSRNEFYDFLFDDYLDTEKAKLIAKKINKYQTFPYPVYDVMGIYTFTGCANCEDEQKQRYSPDVFTDSKAYRQRLLDYGERLDDDYEGGGGIELMEYDVHSAHDNTYLGTIQVGKNADRKIAQQKANKRFGNPLLKVKIKKKGVKSYEGGGLLYGYEEGLWFDHILEGEDATEKNAIDHALGLDWQSIESRPDRIAYMQYIDTINGVGIYYNYGTDSYHFKDETEKTYSNGGEVEDLEDELAKAQDELANQKRSDKDPNSPFILSLERKIADLEEELSYHYEDDDYAKGGSVKKKK